jgi:replication fork protection complex subunit Csm3/Swi3
MASIDDIWDEPLAPPSPKQMDKGGDDDGNGVENDASHRSVNRSRSTLFLDSDSENETGSAVKPPADIEDLFKELDDTPIEELQITPSLDLDALRHAANAEQAKNPRTPYEILSGSSPHKEGALGNDKNEDKDKEKGETKMRKTIPRLDEGRLLGPNGIPALMKEAKKFKIKGKGHEVSWIFLFP